MACGQLNIRLDIVPELVKLPTRLPRGSCASEGGAQQPTSKESDTMRKAFTLAAIFACSAPAAFATTVKHHHYRTVVLRSDQVPAVIVEPRYIVVPASPPVPNPVKPGGAPEENDGG
jgi:hypothetical protein